MPLCLLRVLLALHFFAADFCPWPREELGGREQRNREVTSGALPLAFPTMISVPHLPGLCHLIDKYISSQTDIHGSRKLYTLRLGAHSFQKNMGHLQTLAMVTWYGLNMVYIPQETWSPVHCAERWQWYF